MRNINGRMNSTKINCRQEIFLLTALSLALVFFSPAAWGSEVAPVQVLEVSAATPNVEVVLHWNEEATFPSATRVVVRDVSGDEVSSTWVVADEPGFAEVKLPNALFQIALRGTQYFVHLEDDAGTASGAPFPYQVTLRCESPETCRFVLRGGIDASDAALMDSALSAALEEAAATGGDEMLATVLTNHPDLLGQVYTLGWQVAMLEDRFPVAQPCSCRFTAVVENTNSVCQKLGAAHAFQVNLTNVTDPGIDGCSNLNWTPQQVLDRFEMEGSSTLRVSPLCWIVSSSTVTEVSILGPLWEGTEEFPTVELATCSVECVGGLTYSASYSADLTVAGSSVGQVAVESVMFEANGLSHASIVPWEAKTQYGVWMENETGGDSWSRNVPLGAEASLHSFGMIDLSQGSEGYGFITTEYSIEASAQSTCTGPLDAEISAGGVMLPEASSKVGGHEINILIGRVDG